MSDPGIKKSVVASIASLLAVAGASHHALADETQACVSSYELAQKARKAGELREARAHLLRCVSSSCPVVLRQDCAPWLDEVERAMPTILVEARDARGGDVADVEVLVDGEKVPDHVAGRAFAIDPGPHEIVVRHGSAQPSVQQVVVREGERGRRIEARFGADDRTLAARPVPPGVYVAGAVGLASLGVMTWFGLSALSERSRLDDRGCKPTCSDDDVSSIEAKYAVSNVALAVGVVSLGAAAWMWAARPAKTAAPRAPTGSASIGAWVLPRSAGLGVHGSF